MCGACVFGGKSLLSHNIVSDFPDHCGTTCAVLFQTFTTLNVTKRSGLSTEVSGC